MAKELQQMRPSEGDIAGRLDDLAGTTKITVFETPEELGVHVGDSETDVGKLRTTVSGDVAPQLVASMNKRTFYRNNMLGRYVLQK